MGNYFDYPNLRMHCLVFCRACFDLSYGWWPVPLDIDPCASKHAEPTGGYYQQTISFARVTDVSAELLLWLPELVRLVDNVCSELVGCPSVRICTDHPRKPQLCAPKLT